MFRKKPGKSSSYFSLLDKEQAVQTLKTVINDEKEDDVQRGSLDDLRRPVQNSEQISDLIGNLELLKYPSDFYDVKMTKVEVHGKPLKVLSVQFEPDTSPSPEQIKHFQEHALLIRKLSIILGILNMLQMPGFLKPELSETEKKKIKDYLIDLSNDLRKEFVEGKETEKITKDFSDFVKNDIQKKLLKYNQDAESVTQDIRKAEKYAVASLNAGRAILTNLPCRENDEEFFQLDLPFRNELTDRQKDEYMKIHSLNPPYWFKELCSWEREWLLNLVPTSRNGPWDEFESLFQSSAMQNLPGLKNARMSFLLCRQEKDKVITLSESSKTATPVPYEMSFSEDVKENAQLNYRQLLDRIVPAARHRIKKKWGIDYLPLIFVDSLLSESTKGNAPGGDSPLIDKQQDAFQEVQSDYEQWATIVQGDDGINFLRKAQEKGSKHIITIIRKKEESDSHVKVVLDYAKDFCDAVSTGPKSAEMDSELDLIKMACEELERLPTLDWNDQFLKSTRNRALYRAAYLAVLVDAMGGFVNTNCKSGKDRTGEEEIYVKAMQIYFRLYKQLPKIDDVGEERSEFISIVKTIYISEKTQEAAGANTPGSDGLKDWALSGPFGTPGILDDDVHDALGEMYKATEQLANLNKPRVFKGAEKNETKASKKLFKILIEHREKLRDSGRIFLDYFIEMLMEEHLDRLKLFSSKELEEYLSKMETVKDEKELKDSLGVFLGRLNLLTKHPIFKLIIKENNLTDEKRKEDLESRVGELSVLKNPPQSRQNELAAFNFANTNDAKKMSIYENQTITKVERTESTILSVQSHNLFKVGLTNSSLKSPAIAQIQSEEHQRFSEPKKEVYKYTHSGSEPWNITIIGHFIEKQAVSGLSSIPHDFQLETIFSRALPTKYSRLIDDEMINLMCARLRSRQRIDETILKKILPGLLAGKVPSDQCPRLAKLLMMGYQKATERSIEDEDGNKYYFPSNFFIQTATNHVNSFCALSNSNTIFLNSSWDPHYTEAIQLICATKGITCIQDQWHTNQEDLTKKEAVFSRLYPEILSQQESLNNNITDNP
ncbi:MAG TPA: hypothetical protein VLH77_02145 [Gammaproteobacteria bacterium]|nr:hypothetical protein [Gammaproteobacteria bacterium]